MFFTLASTLLPIFGIIFLGMLVARKALMPASIGYSLNQFVYWVSLPALVFNYLGRMDLAAVPGAFFLAVYSGLGLGYFLCFAMTSKGFRAVRPESYLLSFLSCFPNAAFMGGAIVSFLLPGNEEALGTVALCAVVFMPVMLFTDTKLEMDRHKGEKTRQALLSLGRTVVRNPALMGSLAGVVISLAKPPGMAPILNMAGLLGQTAAPCALFAMGMALAEQVSSSLRPPPGAFWRQFPVHAVKLALLPLATFAALRFAGIEGVQLGVATLCAGMPTGVVAYVVAEKFQVSVEDTSLGIFISTLASMASAPATIAALYALDVL